jgi:hypothetical protein
MTTSCVRLRWSDWERPEPARFDLQEMLDFCHSLPEGWSVRISNATGRIGRAAPAGMSRVAEVEFCFPDLPCLERFRGRFRTVLAETEEYRTEEMPA